MQFNILQPEFRANPYPFFDVLRATAPVFVWEEWGIWFLTRYEDCNNLLRDNRLAQGQMTAYPES
jgi:cytochrome P450